MKIKPSHTSNSSIVAMGLQLQKAMKESGKEYLMLNRGVNSVVNIKLESVIKQIDFNSNEIQVYPGTKGSTELRKAINMEFFDEKAELENILVTGGGISGLDICFQNLDANEILFPRFYWGTYTQLSHLRNIPFLCYESYEQLALLSDKLEGKAVIICDPGNPLGDKYPDDKLFELIKLLNDKGAVVLFDSPYRRLFFDKSDAFYQKMLPLENVIIIESFSKSVGLSGQRLGFIHCSNKNFNNEAALRIMYATNGINGFAQLLVSKLLTTIEGIKAVTEFKLSTTTDIKKNIDFLDKNGLLANEFYKESLPLGIFAVINRSPNELFSHQIGSVGLDYFVKESFGGMENYSRILVSYPNEKFVSYFRTLAGISGK
jgi:aspartate/methionine/tyrosine aminotransferase